MWEMCVGGGVMHNKIWPDKWYSLIISWGVKQSLTYGIIKLDEWLLTVCNTCGIQFRKIQFDEVYNFLLIKYICDK